MKKLFMFLAVAGLATFGTACSSSDDSNPDTKVETLVVSSSKATPEVGETVTFTVMEGKNDVSTTAEILVNGTKITGRTLKSDKPAEFKITAKKAGANDAVAITVKFVEKGTELKQLVLTATPATIALNAETVFKVTLDGADVTGTATIKVGGTVVTGGKYKGTAAGTFTAVASLAGAKDSAAVTIIVKEADVPVPTTNFVSVGSTSTPLLEGAVFYFATAAGPIYTETIGGKVYVPFSIRVFNSAVNGTVPVDYYDNSAILLIFVEQVTGSADVNTPWTATASQILIGGLDGQINKVAYTADDETGFMAPVFTAPVAGSTDGKGTVKFAVEGNTKDGDELLADFSGKVQGFYKITMPAAKSTSNSANVKEASKKLNALKAASSVRVKAIK